MRKNWLLAIALVGCGSQNKDSIPAPLEVLQKIEDVAMVQTESGVKLWRLKSPLVQMHEQKQIADLQDPEMEFYKDNHLTSRAVSKMGTIQTETREVTLKKSVVVHSPQDSSTLLTEILHYSSSRKKIFTEEKIELRKPDAVMRGRGFESNPDLSEFVVKHQETILHSTKQ
ncbi:MAG: LPS export ABC transporter periplasmic protein LptC [Elusimicrobia bacterium]|nr:LPS export ABC transporter periplasmic protein LptC [Elusimicrobiota bacterium]